MSLFDILLGPRHGSGPDPKLNPNKWTSNPTEVVKQGFKLVNKAVRQKHLTAKILYHIIRSIFVMSLDENRTNEKLNRLFTYRLSNMLQANCRDPSGTRTQPEQGPQEHRSWKIKKDEH